LDAAKVFASRLTWATDEFPWLWADWKGHRIFLRLNTAFPDEPMFSLLVDQDPTVDFDDFPPSWTRGPLDWPETTQG
jgi:hypothetical protein